MEENRKKAIEEVEGLANALKTSLNSASTRISHDRTMSQRSALYKRIAAAKVDGVEININWVEVEQYGRNVHDFILEVSPA